MEVAGEVQGSREKAEEECREGKKSQCMLLNVFDK